jgi:hypothetical protein
MQIEISTFRYSAHNSKNPKPLYAKNIKEKTTTNEKGCMRRIQVISARRNLSMDLMAQKK